MEDRAETLQAVGRLAGGIAHDFNNLLTAISGYAEFALGRLEPDEAELRRDIDEIRNASERAALLTAQLLAFSGRQILRPSDVNLNELVDSLQSGLLSTLGENVELSTPTSSAGALLVHVDREQLEGAVVDIVLNGRDAMPGGGRVTIETSIADVDGASYAVLAVRDTGAGLAPEDAARVFEPFFTTKEVGRGTGLTLAAVHGFVRQSGGFARVTSTEGHGATFELFLPRIAAVPEAVDAAPAALPVSGPQRILLVEDEPVVRSLVRQMLASGGYDVVEAEDGRVALARAQACEGPIDLLLTDVVMPHMSGHELAARLRSRHPETRVLYTSGYTDSGGVLAEGEHFLQKPFGIAALAEKVRAVLAA